MNLTSKISENKEYISLCKQYDEVYRSISAKHYAIGMCDHYAYLVQEKSIEEVIKYVDCRMNQDLFLLNVPRKESKYKLVKTNY